jgi:glycosyltransferase involved in cell wall biosynthesis
MRPPTVVATPAPVIRIDGGSRLSLRVAWVGPRPAWLELDEARAELESVELGQFGPGRDVITPPDIAHVARAALDELGRVRETLPESLLVLDLTSDGDAALTPLQARQAQLADAVIAGSRWELAELGRLHGLPARAAVVQRPLDLDWHAPEAGLAEAKGRGRDLRRFRRFHRLARPVVLFAGPYTEAGGLDLLLEAVFGLRERMPDLRLAAIPHGPTDPGYRDRCEMRALGLGHHGIVEWEPVDSEIPFWYAIAAVVCSPPREAVSPEPAKRAAAAGRPFVGSNVEPFREHVDDGTTGYLIPIDNLESLRATLESVLGAEEDAARLGDAALRKAKADYSPAAAAQGLRREWASLVDTRIRSTSSDSSST